MKKQTKLTAMIEAGQAMKGYSNNDVSKLLLMTDRTLLNRKNDNGSFQLDELEQLAKALNMEIVITKNGTEARVG